MVHLIFSVVVVVFRVGCVGHISRVWEESEAPKH